MPCSLVGIWIQFGSLPDWLAAIGTVGALSVALSLLWSDRRERRRSQAAQVIIEPSGVEIDDPQRAPGNRRYTNVRVENASPLPIYHVFLEVITRPVATFLQAVTGPVDTLTVGSFEIIPSGAIEERGLPTEVQIIPGRSLATLLVRFDDAAGRHWVRDGRGRLVERRFKRSRVQSLRDRLKGWLRKRLKSWLSEETGRR